MQIEKRWKHSKEVKTKQEVGGGGRKKIRKEAFIVGLQLLINASFLWVAVDSLNTLIRVLTSDPCALHKTTAVIISELKHYFKLSVLLQFY